MGSLTGIMDIVKYLSQNEGLVVKETDGLFIRLQLSLVGGDEIWKLKIIVILKPDRCYQKFCLMKMPCVQLSQMQMTMEKMLEVDSDYWRGYVELEGDTLYPR